MLRRASVLLGLGILLSLLFPLAAILQESGVDPRAVRLPGVDFAALGALGAVVPAFLLSLDAQLDRRLARWNAWLALLLLSSVLFIALHVRWSADLAGAQLRELLAAGTLPLGVSWQSLLQGAELAARVGVLVCLTGVLLNLQSVAEAEPAQMRGRKK